MRFQPKMRASIDHIPGPNIARAPPMVPSKRETIGSLASARVCHISTKATSVPTMGVQSPGIRRIPDPVRNTAITIVSMDAGASLASVKPARITSAEPTTRRMRSKPKPGQPPANVEYKRRTDAPF